MAPRLRMLLLLALLCLAAAAPAAVGAARFEVHAHRGGTLENGVAVAPENGLTAFEAAHGRGADVVELDTHVSKDRVTFVMHDATLDRTTDCTGNVADHTAAELDACHIDTLGPGDMVQPAPGATEPVPRLAAVLEWAKSSGARLNIELNYYPTEPAASTTPNFIADVLDTIDASGVPKDHILIQSFLPDNLEPAKARGYKTALITFQVAESSAVATASDRGFDVIEPQWPLKDPKAFLASAHAAGKRVIPFTLDARSDLVAAKRAGMDGVISDDAPLARAVVRCEDARGALKRASKRLKAAKAAARRARSGSGSGSARRRRAAARRVRAAKRRVAKARRAFKSACA